MATPTPTVKHTVGDPLFTLFYLFEGGRTDPGCVDAIDADDSGELNLTDAYFLLAYLFLGADAPPLPFGSCGRDGTPDDELTCNEHDGCVEDRPDFEIPDPPTSFADGGANNQEPPAELLAPEYVPLSPVDVTKLDPETQQLLEQEALALARAHLVAQGFSAADDVAIAHFAQDEFGSFHVKLEQTFNGVPVIGAGAISHLYQNRELTNNVTDDLIQRLDVSTTPRIAEPDALATAQSLYPEPLPPGATLEVEQRLAIRPTFVLQRLTAGGPGNNTDDYTRDLDGARLVWDITLAPEIPDLDEATFASLAGVTLSNDEEDDETLQQVREDNLTTGGNDEEPLTSDQFNALLALPPVRFRIDPITGVVLSQEKLVEELGLEEAEGTGYGYFSGKVDLDTSYWESLDRFFLADGRRPADGFNVISNAKKIATHNSLSMSLMADFNNSWGDASIFDSEGAALNTTRRQTPAVDVAHGLEMSWDLFKNVLFRNGFDGLGATVRACVHYDDGYTDAHYNRGSKFCCFGDSNAIDKAGNYSTKTVGHELGHNFWHAVGNAASGGESSALNDGHGDIMGSLVDFYRTGSNGNGFRVQRFDNFTNWKSRLRNPLGYDEEDDEDVTHLGLSYWSASLKDKPSHVAGLPFGRAFIYLAEGSPDDNTNTLYTTEFPDGVGMTSAAHIWKTAVAYYISGTPTYAKMRTAFYDAATYLYGNNSMERRAVQRAFAGIRVGSSVSDTQNPEITYAKIYDVSLTDMTAKFFAILKDDTGIKELRVNGHKNNGFYYPERYVNGYLNISRASAGEREFNFVVEDSAGKTASVNRSFKKAFNRNLIVNGDFEDDMDEWVSDDGTDYVGANRQRAFLGDRYLGMRGSSVVYQEVDVPANAENVKLVYRVLVRNSTQPGEWLGVSIDDRSIPILVIKNTPANKSLAPDKNLAYYGAFTSRDGRSVTNKGFVRQEFDISEYAGQKIRVTFTNNTPDDKARVIIDQVVLSYTQEAFLGATKVSVFNWENTVAFQLPEYSGVTSSEIHAVEYWVDGQFATYQTNPTNQFYNSRFLHTLAGNPHFVVAVARDVFWNIIAISPGVWFEEKNVNELLTNGDFEDGPWDLVYSNLPPHVSIAQDVIDFSIAYDGDRALKMGGLGTAHISQAGQVVSVPNSIKTLDFSVRVRVSSDEGEPDNNQANDDEITLELWNANTFQKISEHLVASFYNQYSFQGTRDLFGKYWRSDVSVQPGQYAGKDIIVLLKVKENDGAQTRFYLDNASLRYTHFGLQINN